MEGQHDGVTRRAFLHQAGLLGASATISSLVAIACSSTVPPAPAATASGAGAPTAASAPAAPSAAPAAAAPAAATVAAPAQTGKKHTLVWVTQALGEWQAPMLTGYRDFLDMAGWDFVG